MDSNSESSPEKSMVEVDLSSESIENNDALDETIRQKKEELLKYKVNELQRICATLTAANRKLLDRL